LQRRVAGVSSRHEVMNATGRRQQPFTYGSLPAVRDYFFLAGW
jgi:hypothetical protein